jgi:hypothetical protein
VTVFRGDAWVGEISTNARVFEIPGALQDAVDDLTGRGVHPMLETK